MSVPPPLADKMPNPLCAFMFNYIKFNCTQITLNLDLHALNLKILHEREYQHCLQVVHIDCQLSPFCLTLLNFIKR